MRFTKLLIALTILLFAIDAHARKDDFILGLQFGYNGLIPDAISKQFNNGLNVGLTGEYMKSERGALTFALDYDTFSSKDVFRQYTGKIHSGVLSTGYKYYLNNFNKSITPYLGVMLAVHYVYSDFNLKSEYANDKTLNTNEHSQEMFYGLRPMVGVSFPISKRMCTNIDASYRFTWQNSTASDGWGNTYNYGSVTDYTFWRVAVGLNYNFN